jgi:hypothetical protein
MKREAEQNTRDQSWDVGDGWDLNDLLHPAQAFENPAAVVNDPDLTINEKRAILASWASDACAIEAAPSLRAGSHGSAVRFDEIMDALRSLDKQANGDKYRRVVRRKHIFRRSPAEGDSNAGTPSPITRRRL